MAAFLARRLAQGALVVALSATIVFVLIRLAPGDPFAASMANPNISESVRAEWRRSYGLDEPLPEQYVRYLGSLARGDLGFSHSLQRPVKAALADALPNTLLLMSIALAASFALGIAVALAQVKRIGRRGDHLLGGFSMLLFSVPDFWLALLILTAVAHWLPGFPIGGSVDPVVHDLLSPAGRMADRVKHVILPALTLTLLYFPLIARHQRAALLDALPSGYVMTARSKGVPEALVLRKHTLRNALLPVVALFGLAFPALLTGAVFVEKVFSWPGMGLIIVNAISTRDYPLVTATVLLGSGFVVVGGLATDLLHQRIDPRLRDEL
ncbi:MAG: ABC transporter permease [Gemmatimonadaceae bacterium]|nr:ABC transporter permease [Gemmatimonadaceae bacterium]MDQ3243085.1 ABC transporter permease [Gemmatimonadota bacterium]